MFMKRLFAVAVVCLLSGVVASAQMKIDKPAAAPGQKNPLSSPGLKKVAPNSFERISQADAVRLYQSGQAVFIDVRSNEQFSYGHIRGALSIPRSQIVKRFNEVPPGKTVITYCACTAEQSSGQAAASLTAHGVKKVFALKGGWADWKSGGNATAVGPK
jgi:rhodanese-related sulfurtransferase